MREKILKLLERKGERGILQSEIPERLNLSKSTVSEQLSELERNNLVFREKVAGKSNRVWLTEEVPHPIEGTARIGILKAAEYPHVLIASENLEERTHVSVFNSARDATEALAKGKVDMAFSPLITQTLYSLVSGSFKICGGCARGGYGIVSREPPSENTSFGSSQLSTMEMNLKAFLKNQGLDPYSARIRYFETPEGIFDSYLNGKTEAVAIWEPYLSLLKSTLKSPEVYIPAHIAEDQPCCTMAVNNDFLRENKGTFLEFARGYAEATETVRKQKKVKEAADLLSEKTELDKNLLKASFKNYEFEFLLNRDEIKNYIKGFNLGALSGDLSQTFKPEHMDEALRKE